MQAKKKKYRKFFVPRPETIGRTGWPVSKENWPKTNPIAIGLYYLNRQQNTRNKYTESVILMGILSFEYIRFLVPFVATPQFDGPKDINFSECGDILCSTRSNITNHHDITTTKTTKKYSQIIHKTSNRMVLFFRLYVKYQVFFPIFGCSNHWLATSSRLFRYISLHCWHFLNFPYFPSLFLATFSRTEKKLFIENGLIRRN